MVPTSLRTRILNIAQYCSLPGDPGDCWLYDSLRQGIYCLNMVINVHKVVNNCTKCSRMGTKPNHQIKSELLPAAGLLDFVAIDILGPLSKAKARNQFVVVMIDKCTRLTKVIPATETTPRQVANNFFNDWIILYGIPDTMPHYSVQQFVTTFSAALYSYLGTTKLTTTALHPLSKGQAVSYSRAFVSRLRPHIADNRKKLVYLCAAANLCIRRQNVLLHHQEVFLVSPFMALVSSSDI